MKVRLYVRQKINFKCDVLGKGDCILPSEFSGVESIVIGWEEDPSPSEGTTGT